MKIQNALVLYIPDRSQRYFAHVTTVTLSWRVQNIVVIGGVYFTLECFEFSSNFEFDRNMLSGTGAWCWPGTLSLYGTTRPQWLELPWWRHQMETFSALLALCAGNSSVIGEFPSQRPMTRSFDVFFDLRLNKRLSKQSRGWWCETPSRPLWRHCNFTLCE